MALLPVPECTPQRKGLLARNWAGVRHLPWVSGRLELAGWVVQEAFVEEPWWFPLQKDVR